MKKLFISLIMLLALAQGVFAADNGGLVAVKTEDGVFLSWNMQADKSEYTLYRNDVAIATLTRTNYTDTEGDSSASYRIDDKAPVSVWDNQYLEIPIQAPTVDVSEQAEVCTVKPNASAAAIAPSWTIASDSSGYKVFISDDGKVLDVNAQGTTAGTKVGTYAYNNGDNQKFTLEETSGGYLIKGKQSGLYLSDNGEALTLQEQADASVFTIEYTDAEPSEAATATAKSVAGAITYSANDASVGDLDGDGELEIVLKWDPSDSKDASQNGKTGKVYIDAYKLDGTRLWRIDLGQNIRAGAHDTQFLVCDFDGDGKAEVAFRTADGTVDGLGNVIGDASAVWTDNGTGKNLEGPLWVSVFDGASGKVLASTPFDPQSNEPSTEIFGDGYGNRSERYNACVAYLDGENPYMVFQRGYYGGKAEIGPGRTVIAAYGYKDGTITKYWRFDTMDEGNDIYIGQGNHNISVGDCDNDGKDEIFTGALALDDDGSALWCSFMGHGDAMHLGDFDPEREGLELFVVHENSTDKQKYGFTIFDAKTGEIIWAREAGRDTGRGLIANVGSFGGSYVAWAGAGAGKINSLGEDLDLSFNSMNFRIYWDGDLYDELLDGTCIFKVNSAGEQELMLDSSVAGCASNNGSKSNPCLQADLFGDWREEVIWRTADNSALRIYTTTIPTRYSFMPLMSDHVYRMGVAWQNSGYNQPPHLGYYLEEKTVLTVSSQSAEVNGRDVTLDSAPYIENSRTMVPLCFIAEAFGADVSYADGTVTIKTDSDTIVMNIGSSTYYVNSETKTMDTAPVIVADRTMVPVRAVSEGLGMNVAWDEDTRQITVRRGDGSAMTTAEATRKQDVKIFIASDSTAQSYRDSYAPQAGWGQMLGLFYDDSVTVENRAMAGRSLKSFFNEGRWSSILNDAQSGDYVIIQFGHNDGAWNKPERYLSHEDFTTMLEEEYIEPALDKGLNVVIATQTQSHWFDASTGLIGEPSEDEVSYVTLLRDAAEKYALPLLDINKLSRALENSLGEEESRKLHLYAEAGEYEKYPDGVADNTHFSYIGAYEIAKIAAQELDQISDLKLRRRDGLSVTASFEGEYTFDVRQYANMSDEFSVALLTERQGGVKINSVPVLTKDCIAGEFTSRTSAEGGKITISSEVPVTAEISPIFKFAPEGGIDTATEEFFADIPDGTYDFTFTKADTNRANIFVNSLLVGANVDMYGTVAVPEGTSYTFNDFELTDGAKIKVDQKTTRLASVEAVKSPSIFSRKTKVYVAGDSTLCNYYPVIPATVEKDIEGGTIRTGWGQLLSRFVGESYDVVNLASSGDWARDWKDCIFPTIEAQGKSGDILVIQFGINDRNRDDKTKDTMKTALTYMIEECEARGIIPVLVKPQPSVGYSWGGAGEYEMPNGSNGGFFDAVKEVADETGCLYVDLYSLAGEHFAEVGRDYVSRNYQLWNSETNEMSDKLHISFVGAKKLCSLFCENAASQGILTENEYYEVTDIVSDVYVFDNGTRMVVYNGSAESKTVTANSSSLTIAAHSYVALNASGIEISVE